MLYGVVWCALMLAPLPGGAACESAAACETAAACESAAAPLGPLGAEDALMAELAGGLPLVLCEGCQRRRCAAAPWRRDSVLVRKSCFDELQPHRARVLRAADDPCDLASAWWRGAPRPVAALDDPAHDLVLLALEHALELDPPPVRYLARRELHLYKWLEEASEKMEPSKPRSPVLLLFLTGVLPATLLVLVFLCVTFGTGTPIKVPYSTEKEGIITPWMDQKYPSDVKCFPMVKFN